MLLVRDRGTGFDPVKVPDPTEGENIYKAHGRGIFIIRQMMDRVRYRRGGREVVMRKQRRS
jgi:serine/threonine-protein kinase RsbW